MGEEWLRAGIRLQEAIATRRTSNQRGTVNDAALHLIESAAKALVRTSPDSAKLLHQAHQILQHLNSGVLGHFQHSMDAQDEFAATESQRQKAEGMLMAIEDTESRNRLLTDELLRWKAQVREIKPLVEKAQTRASIQRHSMDYFQHSFDLSLEEKNEWAEDAEQSHEKIVSKQWRHVLIGRSTESTASRKAVVDAKNARAKKKLTKYCEIDKLTHEESRITRATTMVERVRQSHDSVLSEYFAEAKTAQQREHDTASLHASMESIHAHLKHLPRVQTPRPRAIKGQDLRLHWQEEGLMKQLVRLSAQVRSLYKKGDSVHVNGVGATTLRAVLVTLRVRLDAAVERLKKVALRRKMRRWRRRDVGTSDIVERAANAVYSARLIGAVEYTTKLREEFTAQSEILENKRREFEQEMLSLRSSEAGGKAGQEFKSYKMDVKLWGPRILMHGESTYTCSGLGGGEHVPPFLRHEGDLRLKKLNASELHNVLISMWSTRFGRFRFTGDSRHHVSQTTEVAAASRAPLHKFLQNYFHEVYGDSEAGAQMAYSLWWSCGQDVARPGAAFARLSRLVMAGSISEHTIPDSFRMLQVLKRFTYRISRREMESPTEPLLVQKVNLKASMQSFFPMTEPSKLRSVFDAIDGDEDTCVVTLSSLWPPGIGAGAGAECSSFTESVMSFYTNETLAFTQQLRVFLRSLNPSGDGSLTPRLIRYSLWHLLADTDISRKRILQYFAAGLELTDIRELPAHWMNPLGAESSTRRINIDTFWSNMVARCIYRPDDFWYSDAEPCIVWNPVADKKPLRESEAIQHMLRRQTILNTGRHGIKYIAADDSGGRVDVRVASLACMGYTPLQLRTPRRRRRHGRLAAKYRAHRRHTTQFTEFR